MNSSLDLSACPPTPIHTAAEMVKLVNKKEAHMTAFTALLTAASPRVYRASLHREPRMKAIGYGVGKKSGGPQVSA